MNDTLVWISGASSGIGAALAATVPFDDAVVFDLSRSGGAPGTTHVRVNLAEPGGWGAAADHFTDTIGGFAGRRVVFIHNAASVEPIGFAGEVDPAAYQRNVLLNSAAPQVLGDAFLRAVRGFEGEAHLVMVSSGNAHNVYPGVSSYSAGKAAINHWTRTVGAEQQERQPGCRVVAVAPGNIDTPMQERMRAESSATFPRIEKFVKLHATGDLVRPEEAARDIWGLLDRDLGTGAVVDLRDL